VPVKSVRQEYIAKLSVSYFV